MNINFYDKIKEITDKDPRYHPDAYELVMQTLWWTQKKLKHNGHISGRQLAEGMRDFVLNQYGPLAKTVLNYWGVNSTADFGEIVFNMIGCRMMRKSDEDSLRDFENVYDFEEALDVFKIRPYREKKRLRRFRKTANKTKNLL